MLMKRNLLILFIVALGLFNVNNTFAQISLTAIDVAYTQNFDFFGDATVFYSDNDANFLGFYSFRTVGNVQPQELRRYTVGVSTSNVGRFYNAGNSTTPAERALNVAYSSATGELMVGFRFKNNTGVTIKALDISYNGEQYRVGGATGPPVSIIPNTLAFEYQQGAIMADLTSGTYTAVAGLSFTSPNLSEASLQTAVDGNLPENKVAISGTINVTIPAGEEIMLKWVDRVDDAGFDHQLAIDDLSVTPRALATGTGKLESEKQGISVYPNPVKDVLNLNTRNLDVTSFEIYDVTGRRVLSRLVESSLTTLNVTDLPKGIYMVKAKLSGKTLTSKFVKN
jgi:hypothetical protein